MSKAMRTYDVVQSGYFLGDFYAAGATVTCLPEQAKYDLPPHGAMLAEQAEPKAEPAPAPQSRRPSRTASAD